MAGPKGGKGDAKPVDVFRRGYINVQDKKRWPRRFAVLDNDNFYILPSAPDEDIDRVSLRQGMYEGTESHKITRLTIVEESTAKRAAFSIRIFNPRTKEATDEILCSAATSIDRTLWLQALQQATANCEARFQVQQRQAASRLPLVPNIYSVAYGETGPQRRAFDRDQRGVPITYRHQFFFVRYGVSVMQAEQRRRKLIMEVAMYSCFLALLLSYVMLNVWVPDGAYLREATTNHLTSVSVRRSPSDRPFQLDGIRTRSDLYDWLDEVVAKSALFSGGELGLGTLPIGAVRLRQLRVKEDASCAVAVPTAQAALNVSNCFPAYSLLTFNEEPFGPGTPGAVSFPERVGGKYTFSGALDSLKITVNGTDTGMSYPPALARFSTPSGASLPPSSGFKVDLPRNRTRAAAILAQLRADAWIDVPTRVVILSHSLYNPNLNLFGFAQYLIELPPSGVAAADVAFRPLRLPGQDFKDPAAFDDFPIRIALGVFTLVYFVRLYLAVRAFGASVWDALDLVNLAIVLASLGLRALWFTSPYISKADEYIANTDYINFEGIGWMMNIERAANGFNLLLTFFKFFKFLRVDVRLSVVLAIISTGARGYLSFAVSFVLFILGFSFMGVLTFGASLAAFKDTDAAFITLLNIMVGNTDYVVSFNNDAVSPAFENGFHALTTAGRSSTTVFGSTVGFYTAFNLVFLVLLGSVLAVIAVVAYGHVRRVVALEQELARNRQHLKRLSILRTGKSVSARALAEAERYVRFNEGQRVVSRIAGDPYLLRDGYLNYHQLIEIIQECAPASRVQTHVDRILDVERVSLARVRDVLALFDTPRVIEQERREREEMARRATLMGGARSGAAGEEKGAEPNAQDPADAGGGDTEALLAMFEKTTGAGAGAGAGGDSDSDEDGDGEGDGEGKTGGVASATQRLLDAGPRDTVHEDDLGPLLLEGGSSDESDLESLKDEEWGAFLGPNTPLGRIRWARDLRRGLLFHAMVFVMLQRWKKGAADIVARLEALYRDQRDLLSKALVLEAKLAEVQDAFTGEPLNPWADTEAREKMLEEAGDKSAVGQALKRQLAREEEERAIEAMRERGERVPGDDSDLDAEEEEDDDEEKE